MRPLALVGLGSNLGDRRAILDGAVEALGSLPGVTVRDVSSYRQTAAVGGPPGQEPFLNGVVAIESARDPFELLAELRLIEDAFGRERHVRWGERTLDLDLLLQGDEVWFTPELILPHPRFAVRRFVVGPAAEVAAGVFDPMTGRSMVSLLANLDRRPSLVCLDHLEPTDELGEIERLAEIQGRVCERLGAVAIRGPKGDDSVSGWADQVDGESSFYRWLEERGRLLNSAEWRHRHDPHRWLVADFSIEQRMKWGKPTLVRAALQREHRGDRSHQATTGAALAAVERALEATLVVLVAAKGKEHGLVAGYRSPVLIVASDDVGDLTEEIVAACVATRT
jgi:2-amino-4-hydroxy-6-hydroxymethyldihydropteridine diphosphokinase